MSKEVIVGLLKRRAELGAEVDALRARVAATVADMRRLDAVVRQFDPAYDSARAFQPKDLARRLVEARGAGNSPALGVVVRRMGMALRHQELNGALRAAREPGRPALWELAG